MPARVSPVEAVLLLEVAQDLAERVLMPTARIRGWAVGEDVEWAFRRYLGVAQRPFGPPWIAYGGIRLEPMEELRGRVCAIVDLEP